MKGKDNMVCRIIHPALIVVSVMTCSILSLSSAEGIEKKTAGSDPTQVQRIDAPASPIRDLPAPSRPPEPVIGQSGSSDKRTIRDFVLFNYAHIADNLLNGGGTYLEALFFLLEIKPEEESARLKEMRRMLIEHERIPDFSSAIAAVVREE